MIETVEADLPLDLLTATSHAIFAAGLLEDDTDHGSIYGRDRFESDTPIPVEALEAMLQALPQSVLRLKGWVLLGGEPEVMLLQYVAGRWSLVPAPDAPRLTRLVSIASDPDFTIAESLKTQAFSAS